MTFSAGALREGILYDLLGRLHHKDRRDATIRAYQERYHVDRRQAARVERTALALLDAVQEPWALTSEDRRVLVWAARLHEIGLAVAYRSYHKHGAYLLRNADMAGFSIDDQVLLAAVVRGHRRRIAPETFHEIAGARRARATRMAALLRVAAIVHRSRRSQRELTLTAAASDDTLTLHFKEHWLDEHPLTRADLEGEVRTLSKVGVALIIH